jgi:hypothetical protein
MQMTDSEIIRNYNQAKDKKIQIGILADLNCCTQDKIEQILGLRKKPKENPNTNNLLEMLFAKLDAIDCQIKDLEEEYKKVSIAIEVLGKVET